MLGAEELTLLKDARDFLDVHAEISNPASLDESDEVEGEDETEIDSDFERTRYASCYDPENFQTVTIGDIFKVVLSDTGVEEQYGAMISVEDSVSGIQNVVIDAELGITVKVEENNTRKQTLVTGQQEYIDMFAQGLLVLKRNLG